MLHIGDVTEEYGEVVAIGFVGERYYWMIKDGVISMIPASVVEPMYSHTSLTSATDELMVR